MKEEKVKIGGRTVSYLSSPDGTVRSYYVADGDFHFVTTSKQLVARFLATASGEGSLGTSREFRHARSVMPISRDDTIWLYLSDAFFRNITGPHYRVEMARRLQAAADIELVQLAKLAAASEAQPGETIEQLKAASLLPPEFGPLPDGSRVVLAGGEVYDSLRGRRGAFLPVSDMPVGKITRAEAASTRSSPSSIERKWGRMDPMIAGVKRTAAEGQPRAGGGRRADEPLAPRSTSRCWQWLGPADDQQLAPIPGDMAAVELVLTDQRVFAGLRDVGRPPRHGAASGAAMAARLGQTAPRLSWSATSARPANWDS